MYESQPVFAEEDIIFSFCMGMGTEKNVCSQANSH